MRKMEYMINTGLFLLALGGLSAGGYCLGSPDSAHSSSSLKKGVGGACIFVSLVLLLAIGYTVRRSVLKAREEQAIQKFSRLSLFNLLLPRRPSSEGSAFMSNRDYY